MQTVTIDYVTRSPSLFQWRIVLVEEGPWNTAEVEARLRNIQERLYACVDAALDGDLARQFPDSEGKHLVIQLDCYDVPSILVRSFFDNFTQGIRGLPDYKDAIRDSEFIRGVSFELTCTYPPGRQWNDQADRKSGDRSAQH